MGSSYFDSPAVVLPEDIEELGWRGEFDRAVRRIDSRLEKDIPRALRKHLTIEKEILKRMPGQYPYTWAGTLGVLRSNVRDFKDCELETLQEKDAANWIYIDGEVRFRSSFLKNVLKARKEYGDRAVNLELVRSKAEGFVLLNRTIAFMKEREGAGCRFYIRDTLGVLGEAERDGEDIRVYLLLSIEHAQVKNMKIHNVRIGEGEVEAQEYIITHPDVSQRTICFHTKHRKGQRYLVEFSLKNREAYRDFSCGSLEHGDPKRIKERVGANGFAEPMDAQLARQPPHIRSAPLIWGLASDIVGGEKDPLKKTRGIYDYITTHMVCSFVRNCFTLTNIMQYAASSLKGDCGVQALLFVTLYRAAGIPARWQAGPYTSPLEINCHDQAQFYTPSHGWRYADCSFGGTALQEGETERWDFYFGNLDPLRLPAAKEFGYEFEPPMDHLRNDPYDNRTGEAEYKDRSLAQGEYNTEYEMISLEDIIY